MTTLEEKILPFGQASSQCSQLVIHSDTDNDFLLDTALNAFPEIWQHHAKLYIENNPDFLRHYGLVVPNCAEDNFDAFEILTMQIVTRRDAIQGLKDAFVQNGQAENIINDLLAHPVMQARINAEEVFPVTNFQAFEAA